MTVGLVADVQTAPAATTKPDPFNCLVIGVIDGDTIRVLTDDTKEQITIRLYGIDAPEKKQRHGPQSKQAMSDMVFNKRVTVSPISVDLYGRTIAKVFVENQDVGQAMVCNGEAWWYCQYARRDRQLSLCQKTAKQQQIGIWSEKNPVAPWDFRKQKK